MMNWYTHMSTGKTTAVGSSDTPLEPSVTASIVARSEWTPAPTHSQKLSYTCSGERRAHAGERAVAATAAGLRSQQQQS